MTTMMTTMKEWEDEMFDFFARIQEPLVKFSGEMAESLADYTPDRPAWPFLAQVPTVSEVVDFQIDFAHRFVDTQATFAKGLVKAWQPVLGKLEPKAAPVRKARTTPKAA
ncbi:MAG TPA: hypothetical protein VF855_07400 [Acidimicrobiales bacterium]